MVASDHRYVFMCFDALVNLGTRGEDTRVLLSRGFAKSQGKGGIRAKKIFYLFQLHSLVIVIIISISVVFMLFISSNSFIRIHIIICRSLSLAYWESMMLPSIFYKDMEDGSILGALPSALLADNKVVHRQGCACL